MCARREILHRKWCCIPGVVWLVLCVAVCAGVCSCESVRYDLRKLDQPVVMNGNPFSCGKQTRPKLRFVDRYTAKVSKGGMVVSSGNQTTSQNYAVNDAQVSVFHKIGGDSAMTITDIVFDTSSLGVYALFLIASEAELTATGVVQRVEIPAAKSEPQVGAVPAPQEKIAVENKPMENAPPAAAVVPVTGHKEGIQ